MKILMILAGFSGCGTIGISLSIKDEVAWWFLPIWAGFATALFFLQAFQGEGK